MLIDHQDIPQPSTAFQTGDAELASIGVRVLAKCHPTDHLGRFDDAGIKLPDTVPLLRITDLAGAERKHTLYLERIVDR